MNLKGKSGTLIKILWGIFTLSAVAGLVAVLIHLWRRFILRKTAEQLPAVRQKVTEGIPGLSEAEAESRHEEGRDNVVTYDPPRDLNDIVRENVLTIFNLSLLGVAAVQLR